MQEYRNGSYSCGKLAARSLYIAAGFVVGNTKVDKVGYRVGKALARATNIVSKNTVIQTSGDIFTSIEKLGFWSRIKMVTDESLTIKEVFKGTAEGIEMSDVVLEQIKFVGKNPNNLKTILLDDVINQELKNALITKGEIYIKDNWGRMGGLDGMVKKILDKTGKSIGEIRVFPEILEGRETFSIRITLN